MPSNWTKQPQYPLRQFFNSGNGDGTLQGGLTTVPSAVGASQGVQDLPGDRLVLGARDAFALSGTTIGTLYEGIYMYVGSNSTAGNSVLGQLLFWDPSVYSVAASTSVTNLDNLYQVTPAELQTGVGRTGIIAGVAINVVSQGNWWWIQIAGKATTLYGASTGSYWAGTATYAINSGVFAGGYGKTAGSGLVTSLNGQIAAPTSTNVADMLDMYVGQAETLPAASGLYITDLKLQLARL
jgi:hypothetical protein